MAGDNDDDRLFFEAIPIEILHRVPAGDGSYHEAKKTWNVDAVSFQQMARTAQEQTERLTPKVRCVLTMRSDADAAFTRQEHFVPEGLGFSWTAPPPGVGTCDEVNGRFSKYEGEWLRQGKMGVFRPFFVGDGKDEPPAYYAPNKTDRKIWFTRAKDGSRTLGVGPDVKVNVPDRSGPGTVLIRVPHNEARVEWVSLALHKMALLMFWLCEGELAFDAAFAGTRRFLIERGAETYRPCVEHVVEGDKPGVELRYLVIWRSVGDGKSEIETVHCTMKVHHMRYVVALAGQPGPTPPGLSWTPWADPRAPVPDHTAIAFGMTGLERKVPGNGGSAG